ncbi:MAG: MgtC/SapB family protein [Treponema sp.]|nr:MgtC/SapB family protein [Candidatus Treponema caballi]
MLEALFFDACDTFAGCVCRVLLSALLGAALGFERKVHNNALGMRTLILISAASCLMTIMSAMSALVTINGYSFDGDPTRITAGIVSGIGFLGGGAIIHRGLNIKGLTTAAVIWMACALGITVGGGQPLYALVTFVISIVSLILIEKLEAKLFPAKHVRKLFLIFENKRIDLSELTKTLEDKGVMVSSMDIARVYGEKHLEVTLTINCSADIDYFDIADTIKTLGKLEEFRLTD